MSHIKNDEYIDFIRERRLEWLGSQGFDEDSVMVDKKGEYVLDTIENGTPGDEDYEVRETKIYLPPTLQASIYKK